MVKTVGMNWVPAAQNKSGVSVSLACGVNSAASGVSDTSNWDGNDVCTQNKLYDRNYSEWGV